MLNPDENGKCPVCGESDCPELITAYDISEAFSLSGQAKMRKRSSDLVTITDRVWMDAGPIGKMASKTLVWAPGDRVDREHADALDAPYESDDDKTDAGSDDPRLNDPDRPAKRGRGRPRKVQPQ